MNEPLNRFMDNVLAYKLGKICMEAASPQQKVGDYIDRGLILRRLLEEGGFQLTLSDSQPQPLPPTVKDKT